MYLVFFIFSWCFFYINSLFMLKITKKLLLFYNYNLFYRSWTIRLVRDASLFSKDVSFESTNGPISFDTAHSYVGTVLGKSI